MTIPPPLVLASASAARRAMLEKAGLDFTAIPADIDESTKNGDPETAAIKLAQQKALHISANNPEKIVIGSDQILSLDNKIFSKAKDEQQAREKLLALKGKAHTLYSAVSIAVNGNTEWSHSDRANLYMKDFSVTFLDSYIEKAGPELTSCVGAYALEGIGINLFEKIEGDYFTILGMPLLPLLSYLETKGIGACL